MTSFVIEIWYAVTHLRYATGLQEFSFWQTLHFTWPKMEFYDPHLDNEVRHARQALSIDENRADFVLVPWGSKKNKAPPRKDGGPDWLQLCGSSRTGEIIRFQLAISKFESSCPSQPVTQLAIV